MPTEAELAAAIAEKMRPLRAHYLDKLRTRMPMMESVVQMLTRHAFNELAERQALQMEAHKLSGNGATYGFPAISQAAKALEKALSADAESDDDALQTLLSALMHACHEAMDDVAPVSDKGAASAAIDAAPQPVVLIADDDATVRDLLASKLGHAGCQVVCAEDGAQAWQMLKERRFALAVLDLMMPGYDGMTLLRMMQEHAQMARTPVVFVTAKSLNCDVLAGLDTGAADYITKPFDSDELVTRCTRLLKPSGRRSQHVAAMRRRHESAAGCR